MNAATPDAGDVRRVADPGVRITATDLKTGEESSRTVSDDVVVIAVGRHYVDGVVKHANGTQVWTIKVTQ